MQAVFLVQATNLSFLTDLPPPFLSQIDYLKV